MLKIIPAIMPSSLAEMGAKINTVRSAVDTVQLDVMDGRFVEDLSWPYMEGGAEELKSIAGEEKGFPYWKEISIEADLMVSYPEMILNLWLKTEIHRLVIHIEASEKLNWVMETINTKFGDFDELSIGGVKLGLALNISTPNEELYKWADRADFVQFMGIAEIGSQGEPFDERVLEKIKDFREKYPAKEISVDGGIKLDNAPQLIEAGADQLVVGSAIFDSENPKEEIEKFKTL